MNEIQERAIVAEIVSKAIESGKIDFNQPPPQVQQIIQEKEDKAPTYEGGRVTFFDLLTCIMFTLNLLGVTNISWWLVFLPFVIPYAVFYGMMGVMILWAKYKNRNNKENVKG